MRSVIARSIASRGASRYSDRARISAFSAAVPGATKWSAAAWWADYDDLDIGVRPDTGADEPAAQHVIMARIAMHDPKAQGLSGRFSRCRSALERRGVDEGQKPMRNVSKVIPCLQGALRSSRSPRLFPQGGGWCASLVRVAARKMQVRRSRAFSSNSFWRGRSSRARPGRSSPRQVRVAVARMPRTAARPGR